MGVCSAIWSVAALSGPEKGEAGRTSGRFGYSQLARTLSPLMSDVAWGCTIV